MTQALTLRPELHDFAQLMERVLRENDHKGGWREGDVYTYIHRIETELAELRHAMGRQRRVDEYKDGTLQEDIAHECADVANFAMFVFDMRGRI